MGSSGLQQQITLTNVADPKKHPPRMGKDPPCHGTSHIAHTLPYMS